MCCFLPSEKGCSQNENEFQKVHPIEILECVDDDQHPLKTYLLSGNFITTSQSSSLEITECPTTSKGSSTSFIMKNCSEKKSEVEEAMLNHCLGIMSTPSDSFEIFGDYVADD